jgi:hypothetical protein
MPSDVEKPTTEPRRQRVRYRSTPPQPAGPLSPKSPQRPTRRRRLPCARTDFQRPLQTIQEIPRAAPKSRSISLDNNRRHTIFHRPAHSDQAPGFAKNSPARRPQSECETDSPDASARTRSSLIRVTFTNCSRSYFPARRHHAPAAAQRPASPGRPHLDTRPRPDAQLRPGPATRPRARVRPGAQTSLRARIVPQTHADQITPARHSADHKPGHDHLGHGSLSHDQGRQRWPSRHRRGPLGRDLRRRGRLSHDERRPGWPSRHQHRRGRFGRGLRRRDWLGRDLR